MKAMKNKKNKKNKSQKAQQSFTERIAKAAGGFKERAKSMNSEEKAEQAQQPEQPETQAQQESGEAEVDVKALQAELEKAKAQSDEYLDLAQRKRPSSPTTAAAPKASARRLSTTDGARPLPAAPDCG